MIKIALFALITLIIIVILRQYHPEYSLLAAVISGGIILIFLVVELANPILTLLKILNSYGVNSQLTEYVLKSLGICIITNFSVGICTDFGQTSLAAKVEMAGKVAIFILSLPILENILEVGLSLL